MVLEHHFEITGGLKICYKSVPLILVHNHRKVGVKRISKHLHQKMPQNFGNCEGI